MNKIVKVNLNTNTTAATVVEEKRKPWYVRAHTYMSNTCDVAKEEIKENKRKLALERQVVKASYAASRAELDALYVEEAKQKMIAIMAKKGITLQF